MPITYGDLLTSQQLPDWCSKIVGLRRHLQLSQESFGNRLHCSAMAVSRWERGIQEPTSRSYLQLGSLSGDPECWYFWERAGLSNEDLVRLVPVLRKRLHIARMPGFEIVSAGPGSRKKSAGKAAVKLVSIPLLRAQAAALGENGDHAPLLHHAEVESVIVAPTEWCPNPATMLCLRVRGKSMMPLIGDGYIVAVDSSFNDRTKLNGKVIVAWHRDKGLSITRLVRYDETEVFQPENREYESVTLNSNKGWKVLAKVMWWIGRAP